MELVIEQNRVYFIKMSGQIMNFCYLDDQKDFTPREPNLTNKSGNEAGSDPASQA